MAEKVRCQRCHRVLKNPDYIAVGYGKVCAAKEGIVVHTTSKSRHSIATKSGSMNVIKGKHLEPFSILPPPAGKCSVCATDHEPEYPHNQQSLFYQYKFYNDNGRWPTWKDAMAHCSNEIKEFWTKELEERGVKVE